MQAICDKYIGLDCNGFVGNWAAENGVKRFTSQTAPPDIARVFPEKRASLSEVEPLDVLVWSSHVAVIDDISADTTNGRMMVWVAEAFGRIMYRPLTLAITTQPGRFSLTTHGGSAVIFPIGLTP